MPLSPTRIKPKVEPKVDPAPRYDPFPQHCPQQWERTIRRIQPD